MASLSRLEALFLDLTSYTIVHSKVNPKRAGGQNPPPRHFLLYLSRLLFFRAETSWLFSFKPCAQFKTLFKQIGPTGYDTQIVFLFSGYTFTMFYLICLVYLE